MLDALTTPPVMWAIICIGAAIVVYLLTLIAPILTDHEACQPAESAYRPESCDICTGPIEKGQSVVIDTVRHSVVHSECEITARNVAKLNTVPSGAENN